MVEDAKLGGSKSESRSDGEGEGGTSVRVELLSVGILLMMARRRAAGVSSARDTGVSMSISEKDESRRDGSSPKLRFTLVLETSGSRDGPAWDEPREVLPFRATRRRKEGGGSALSMSIMDMKKVGS